MDKNKISTTIKELRKSEKLTQKDLAKILFVTPQAVSKWENNKNIPDIETIKLICEKFDIDISKFLKIKKRNYVFFVIPPLLILTFLTGFLIYKTLNTNFELIEVASLNKNFEIKGVVAFSKNKKSVVISDIKYIDTDEAKYKTVECSLYESKDNTKTKLDTCSFDKSSNENSLNKMLEDVNFKIDNYVSRSKTFYPHNLFLEIKATDELGKTYSYEIGVDLKDKCID